MNNPALEYWTGRQVNGSRKITLQGMGYEYMKTQLLKARGLL